MLHIVREVLINSLDVHTLTAPYISVVNLYLSGHVTYLCGQLDKVELFGIITTLVDENLQTVVASKIILVDGHLKLIEFVVLVGTGASIHHVGGFYSIHLMYLMSYAGGIANLQRQCATSSLQANRSLGIIILIVIHIKHYVVEVKVVA